MKNDDLFLEQIPLGPMENFVYMIGSKSTREVALVDPAWDIDFLLNHIDQQDLKLASILVTHYHPDHIGGGMGGHSIEGIAEVLAKKPVKIFVNKYEADGVKKVTGVSDSDISIVESGDHLKIGLNDIEFLHTPGHTPGSQCFKVNDNLISGDTLFIHGCGRVDLPGSDSEDMYHSLQKLAELPDDTILYPGHHYSPEEFQTMGKTKEQNMHLKVPDIETWRQIM
jgi:hydroxyacylglutathione hydrolase|tara:strand:+ start:5002 stop:5676 length:675 start_codon:yes stop_codon:yes gene_type:complete